VILTTRTIDEHDRHTARLAALNAERHKLLDAYYANAIPLELLKAEQDRISRETHRAQQQLDDLNANLDDWHHTLTLAVKFAANCHTAYRAASETAKKQLNHAIFARITLRIGHINQWEFHPPFDAFFNPTRFEYGSKVEVRGIEPRSRCLVLRSATSVGSGRLSGCRAPEPSGSTTVRH
jgi:site-specific DNA recombinase